MNYKILFTSKNNYDLLENWMDKNSTKKIPGIINLDLNSDFSQQEKGRNICLKYNIDYVTAEDTEFQSNIKQAFDHISQLGFNYILYLHQDCFPANSNTFSQIDKCIWYYFLFEFRKNKKFFGQWLF